MNGEPIAVTFWRQRHNIPTAIANYVLRLQPRGDYLQPFFQDHRTKYRDRLLLNLRQLSWDVKKLNSIDLLDNQVLVDTIAHLVQEHMNRHWRKLYDTMHKIQPYKKDTCTVAYFNPLANGRMEWTKVQCSMNLTITNIMCQRNAGPQHNRRVLNEPHVAVYADVSYYNYDSWTINHTHSDSICPVEEGKKLMNVVISCTGEILHLSQDKNVTSTYGKQYLKYFNSIVISVCPSLKGDKSKTWIDFCMFQIQHIHNHIQSHSVTVSNKTLQLTDRTCPKNRFMVDTWCIILVNETATMSESPHNFTGNSSTADLINNILINYAVLSSGDLNMNAKYNGKYISVTPSQLVELTHSCGHLQFQCKDHHCIHDSFVFNRIANCPDGSDEDVVYVNEQLCNDSASFKPRINCAVQMLGSCSHHFFQCLSGECIPWQHFCDNKFDCKDSSDEYHCKFIIDNRPDINEGIFKCHDNEHIGYDFVNDIIPDCSYAEDEMGYIFSSHVCLSAFEVHCIRGHPKCFPLSELCVYDHDKYGHLMHCRNGAHLTHCTEVSCPTNFKCQHSYCIPLRKLCDSVVDCPSGEDEWSCGDTLLCPGFFRCNGGVCIHPTEVCDGRKDCPHGEDELGCLRALCPSECQCFGLEMVCDIMDTSFHLHLFKSFNLINVRSAEIPKLLNCSGLFSISIEKSIIDVIKSYTFAECHNIIYFNIADVRVTSVQPKALFGLASVAFLNISDFNHTVVEPKTFEGMVSLRTLDMSHAEIVHVNSLSFYGLHNLNELNLSHNSIEHFPSDILTYFPHLSVLDISSNPITKVIQSDKILSQPINLYVSQPYICCQSNMFYCKSNFTKSICTDSIHRLMRTALSVYGVFIIIANLTVLIYLTTKWSRSMTSVKVLSLLVFALDSLQGVYIFMAALKDPLFDLNVGGIHVKGGRKHMFCTSAGLLQVLSAMLVSVMKGLQTHYFFNKTSFLTVLASSVRLSIKVVVHVVSLVYVFVYLLFNINYLDFVAFCSALGIASNWNKWDAGAMVYLIVHDIASNAEIIFLAWKIANCMSESLSKVRSFGAVISNKRLYYRKSFIRTIVRAQVALMAELAWFILLCWQYRHGPMNRTIVTIMSVIYTFPAACNPIIYMATGKYFTSGGKTRAA